MHLINMPDEIRQENTKNSFCISILLQTDFYEYLINYELCKLTFVTYFYVQYLEV